MNPYDPQMAERVWQRVQSREQFPQQPSLQPMIAETLFGAMLCQRISAHHNSSHAALLRQILQKKQTHAACLKGVSHLIGEDPSVAAPSPPPVENQQAALRRCLASTLRCAAQHRQWCGHPEYGPIFEVLAQQETDLAVVLLQLLGS